MDDPPPLLPLIMDPNKGINKNTDKLLKECKKIVKKLKTPISQVPRGNKHPRNRLKYVLYLKNGKILTEVKKYYMIKDIIEELGIPKSACYKISQNTGKYSHYFAIEKCEDPDVIVYDL